MTLSFVAKSECSSSIINVLDRLFLMPKETSEGHHLGLEDFRARFETKLYSSKASPLLRLWFGLRYSNGDKRIEAVESLSVYLSLYMTNKNKIFGYFFKDFFMLSADLWRYRDEFMRKELVHFKKIESEERMKVLSKFFKRYKHDFETLARGIHVISNERDLKGYHDFLFKMSSKYPYTKKEFFHILMRVRNKNMREIDHVLWDALMERQVHLLFDCHFNPLDPLEEL